MATQAIDVAGLGTTDLSVCVVALLIGERTSPASPVDHPHLAPVRRLAADVLGTDVGSWLGDSPPDGEQVLYLVDAIGERCRDDPGLRGSLAATVAGDSRVGPALRVLGESCQARAQRDGALHAYGAWLALARAGGAGAAADEAGCLYRLGALFQEMGAYAEAADCHRLRRAVHVRAGAVSEAAEALIDLGWLHSDSGRLTHAARCFDRAAVELQARRPLSAVRALVGLAQVRRRQGRSDEARTLLVRCRQVVGEDAGSETSWLLRRELAAAYEEDGRLGDAGDLHERAHDLPEAARSAATSVGSLRQLARIRLLQSRPLEAAAHYLESIAADPAAGALGGPLSMTAEDADAAAAALRLVTATDPPELQSVEDRDVIATLARPLFRVRRGGGFAVA